MAIVTVAGSNRRIERPSQTREFLEPFGIWFEHWPVDGRAIRHATAEEILAEYAPEVERLKQRGGFTTADVIDATPETPGLDEMLARFEKEHTHSEDEVRFTVEGRGVFWIHPSPTSGDAGVFSMVEAGDMINVPAGTRHWFHLCEDRRIRCIRLFEDTSGWTPHYVDAGVHRNHPPVCWGANYLPHETKAKPVVEL